MLKALQNQLRKLAESDQESYHSALEERLGHKPTEEQIKAIKEFIFMLPPVLKVLSQYWSDKATPRQAKNLSGLIITYIIQANDLISEEDYGLFGYLDDAYLVVSSFLRIQDMYIRDWESKSEMERDLVARTKELINAPRVLIPEDTAKIDDIIDKWLEGKIEELDKYLMKS